MRPAEEPTNPLWVPDTFMLRHPHLYPLNDPMKDGSVAVTVRYQYGKWTRPDGRCSLRVYLHGRIGIRGRKRDYVGTLVGLCETESSPEFSAVICLPTHGGMLARWSREVAGLLRAAIQERYETVAYLVAWMLLRTEECITVERVFDLNPHVVKSLEALKVDMSADLHRFHHEKGI